MLPTVHPPVEALLQRLRGHFTLANLGAGADQDYKAPPEVLRSMTVVELDGGDQGIPTSEVYFRKHHIKEFVSGSGGPRSFYKRAFWGCCGLERANEASIAKYNLSEFYRMVSVETVETRTLSELLAQVHLKELDFLKTDLEGSDFAVIASLGSFLPQMLAVQCELRFDPFYEGEPPADQVMAWMRERDFELIGLKPDFWKPRNNIATCVIDGNLVWADFLFARSEKSVRELAIRNNDTLPLLKHVLLMAILGKFNYASYLTEVYQPLLSEDEKNILPHLIFRFAECNQSLLCAPVHSSFPHIADVAANVRQY